MIKEHTLVCYFRKGSEMEELHSWCFLQLLANIMNRRPTGMETPQLDACLATLYL